MEKLIITMLAGLLLLDISTLATAQITESFGRGIEESPHNFSHPSWLPVSRICNVCHTLHNEALASQHYSNGLHWNSEVYAVSYNMYHSYWGAPFVDTRHKSSWASLTGKRSNLPDGLSKLCLACHDGIIAPDVFILHHFVSAGYDMEETNLRDPDRTLMGNSGSITEVLDTGKIECPSCHDVHGVESVANTKLLRAKKSEICIICHNINFEE